MEKKYSKGDWRVGFRIKGINGGTTIRDSQDRKIAEVIAEEIPVREANKNAHLIKESPNLLEALEESTELLKEITEIIDSPRANAFIMRNFDIIAKAHGETP